MPDARLMMRACRPAARLMLILAAAGTVACHQRLLPSGEPPGPGAFVKATFVPPRSIAVSPDSMLLLPEVSGRIVAVRGDTLVLSLTQVPGPGNTTAWAGHEVTFTVDSTTKVVKTNIDSAVGMLTFVGAVALFTGYMMSR